MGVGGLGGREGAWAQHHMILAGPGEWCTELDLRLVTPCDANFRVAEKRDLRNQPRCKVIDLSFDACDCLATQAVEVRPTKVLHLLSSKPLPQGAELTSS